MVSRAEIATPQRLEDIYIQNAFTKHLESLSKFSTRRYISVY